MRQSSHSRHCLPFFTPHCIRWIYGASRLHTKWSGCYRLGVCPVFFFQFTFLRFPSFCCCLGSRQYTLRSVRRLIQYLIVQTTISVSLPFSSS
ncbi:hypothetical protein T440DRAFT_152280 [Plenodomus tracheiphilus IPT5]|uniref:Uncharacterized protein n=1 Tax=Plenodomus tracheiphilus IPT5 TaxID=1408161 RepID=A0A6A7B312_9PLEO|nr:hypothetical protein T440DRAFT_152280 [Plenodomus tracheiphilus IPT5]